jgi:hypothetical protein
MIVEPIDRLVAGWNELVAVRMDEADEVTAAGADERS